MKTVGIGIACLVALFMLMWLIQGNGFFMYKVFAPKYEQVRRETFEQSKAYNQGMIQELQNMQFQYEQAAPEHKDALAYIILHRVADYKGELPPDLNAFVDSLRNQNSNAR